MSYTPYFRTFVPPSVTSSLSGLGLRLNLEPVRSTNMLLVEAMGHLEDRPVPNSAPVRVGGATVVNCWVEYEGECLAKLGAETVTIFCVRLASSRDQDFDNSSFCGGH